MPSSDHRHAALELNEFWHHAVHERLGEKLQFFIVRARPLDIKHLVGNVNQLVHSGKYGGIHVFTLFGTYDILVRIWLHPMDELAFREALSKAMAQANEDRRIHSFTVERIEQSWYDGHELPESVLRNLNEQHIRKAQDGTDKAQHSLMVQNHVLLTRTSTSDILFYVAIQLRPEFDQQQAEEVVGALRKYLSDVTPFKNVSIYRGNGYCSVLVRGQCANFFDIAQFGWIREGFHHYGATTETYLAQMPGHVFAEETIGDATFSALHGRDLLIQAVLPEVYKDYHSDYATIKKVFEDVVSRVTLTEDDRRFVHDYLLAWLERDGPQMASVVFKLFVECEQYLREQHLEFVRRACRGMMREVLDQASVKEDAKSRTLGTLLNICWHAAGSCCGEKYRAHTGGKDKLAQIRNSVAHQGGTIIDDWERILEGVLTHLADLRLLLDLVAETTESTLKGVYLSAGA